MDSTYDELVADVAECARAKADVSGGRKNAAKPAVTANNASNNVSNGAYERGMLISGDVLRLQAKIAEESGKDRLSDILKRAAAMADGAV